MSVTSKKVCRLCGAEKSLEEFDIARGNTDGRDSRCKMCKREAHRAAYPAKAAIKVARIASGVGEEDCARCKRTLPISDFQSGGNSWVCKVCNLCTKYGLSRDQYEAMIDLNDGCCWVCGTLPIGRSSEGALHIDHDHKTRRVRGLLCGRCNITLGNVRDSSQRLRRLADYLDDPVKTDYREWSPPNSVLDIADEPAN